MPAAESRLIDLLQQPAEAEANLANTLQILHQLRYSGPITLHFSNGLPRVIELPAPKIKLRST